MINFSGINTNTLVGRILRLPLRLVPSTMTVRILQGELRGKKWIANSSNHGCWLGSYEFDKQRLMAKVVKPGKVFFDVGANVGFYTILASVLVGDRGKVFAFEPLPKNVDLLGKHLRMNGLQNAKVFRAAVSDRKGTAFFQQGKSDSMGHLDERGEIRVECLSLDDLISEGVLPLPDYMKIDVEGGELAVLQGAQRTLASSRPTIFLATHGSEVHSKCLAMLQSLGFMCQPIDASKTLNSCDEIIASKDGN